VDESTLILNVFLYSFFTHLSYRGTKVSVAPQHSLLPVESRQVFSMAVPHSSCRHLFQPTHDLQHRERRTRLHQQMHVVPVDANLDDAEVATRRNVAEALRQ
jgi:hypothetical protein